MENHMRDQLKIPYSRLDEINGILLDPEMRVINDFLDVVARYGTPYFANFIGSDMSPEDMRSMCCNLRLDLAALVQRGGGLFGAYPQTGSIGVVTINMPRLGCLSKDEETFMKRLENNMLLAKESLEIKRKILEKFTDDNLYPYMKFFLRNVKKRFGQYWRNHFGTIGFLYVTYATSACFDQALF